MIDPNCFLLLVENGLAPPDEGLLPLSFWIPFWKVVIVGGLILFGLMALWVTIGGFFDIKRLFKRLAESHREEEEARAGDSS